MTADEVRAFFDRGVFHFQPDYEERKQLVRELLTTKKGTLAEGFSQALKSATEWLLKSAEKTRSSYALYGMAAPVNLLWMQWDLFKTLLLEDSDLLKEVEEFLSLVKFPEEAPYPAYLLVKNAKRRDNDRLLKGAQG